MPELQTIVKTQNPGFNISYSDMTCFFGSCFANHIGNKFERYKLNSLVNPYGVLYNPASIAQGIERILKKKTFTEEELHSYHNQWLSFYHYTSFSNPDKKTCLDTINAGYSHAVKSLNIASVVIITLGTSYEYRLKETGKTVANCHKLPDSYFIRNFLKTGQTVNLLGDTIKELLACNPNIRIIITVSPIRHWKDGAIENSRSKAALLLAVKELENIFKEVYYFPVYEIFMDELRDYRFYASDMLHPSEFAIEYIWEKFETTFFTFDTISITNQVEKIKKSLGHKPINIKSDQHQKFLESLKKQIIEFSKKNASIDFSNELLQVNSDISKEG
jgi:hypothetical protein